MPNRFKTTKNEESAQGIGGELEPVRFNVTLPPLLAQHLEKIMSSRGYTGPSAYFQARIRKDAGLELAG